MVTTLRTTLRVLVPMFFLLGLSACAPAPTPTPRPQVTRLLVYAEGRLQYENGCFYLIAPTGAGRSTLVWPPDIVPTLDAAGDRVHITRPDGSTVTVRLDEDRVAVPGGEIVRPGPEERAAVGPQPADCPPPYWLVSDVRSLDR